MSDKSFPNPEAIEIKENSDELKILSWNLWWKFENYIERQELIFQELKSLKPDILFQLIVANASLNVFKYDDQNFYLSSINSMNSSRFHETF